MTRRYLNVNPEGDYVYSESQHFKDRVRNGLARPIAAQPYRADRGSRIDEVLDKPVNIAQAYIIFYLRNFIKKFYPEISETTFKIVSVNPLNIQWQFDMKKDVKNG